MRTQFSKIVLSAAFGFTICFAQGNPEELAAQNQCVTTYNINELLFKVKDSFPAKLKDCSSTLAKDMLNPFGKKLEPKSFMTQCSVDGMKKELPDGFSGTDKIVGSLTNFVQGLLNSASAGGSLDPKKLASSIGSMDIEGLLNDVKKIAVGAECTVDEPYEPSVASVNKSNYSKATETEQENKEESHYVIGIFAGLFSVFTFLVIIGGVF